VYDNSAWTSVGVPVFTVIADEQFNGDGSTVAFTLGSTQTTNSCIVSINGVVQIPTLAYAVAGTDPTCVLTFTEAPAVGDVIDVRQITTTTTVTSIANNSGNAVVATSETAAQVNVTGDLSVSGTILGGNINSTAITSGTSNMAIVSSGGNIRGNVAGTTVMTISPGLVDIVGNLTVSGNATLSGNILGDRIQNGTTSFDIQTPGGNANINIGGTGNLAVFAPGVLNMSGNITPTANITYDLGTTTNRWKDIWLANSTIYLGNAQISANATSLIFTNPSGGQTVLAGATASITGASVSVTGAVTAASVVGGVITGSSVSVTGAQTAASTVGGVITGKSTSVTGTTTAASVAGGVITGTSTSVTGNITGGNILGNGAGLTGINAFSNVTVTGGNSAVADSIADTLTFTAGDGITIVVDSATDTITFGVQSGSELFVDGADFGTVTEPVTLSDDLGLVTDAVTEEADLGSLVTSGLIYPDQFVLPSYTTSTLPSAAVAGAMIYVTNETGGPVPAFADGTNWRRVTDRAIVT
jgi:hypothetical protein